MRGDSLALRSHIAAHTHAQHSHLGAHTAQAKQQARLRLAAARGHDDVRHIWLLREQLLHRVQIPHAAERSTVRLERNEVGNLALSAQILGDRVDRRIGTQLVIGVREHAHARSVDIAEQHIARMGIDIARHAGHAIFKLHMATHAQLGRHGRRCTRVVRLHRTGDQHHGSALLFCLAEVILQLADLVAAKGQPREIVPLDAESETQLLADARKRFDRRRSEGQFHARQMNGQRVGERSVDRRNCMHHESAAQGFKSKIETH